MSRLFSLLFQSFIIIVVFGDRGRGSSFRNVGGYTAWSPVVGILAHPSEDHPASSFVLEYVAEYLESAGIQVVLVRYDDPKLEDLLSRISGVWFPEGWIEVTFDHPYVKAAGKIYDYALKRYSKGDPFPLIGFCEGHQILAALAAGSTNVILKNAYTTDDVALTLQFEGEGGRMLGSFPPDVRQILKTKAVTANMHSNGVPPEMWQKYEGLNKQFTMTSTSKDPENGRVFSATMESKPGMPPMYGLQWHPEIIPYVWDPKLKGALVKTMDSLRVSSAFGLFVAELFHDKLNRFKTDTEIEKALIRNLPVICDSEDWDIRDGTCIYAFIPK